MALTNDRCASEIEGHPDVPGGEVLCWTCDHLDVCSRRRIYWLYDHSHHQLSHYCDECDKFFCQNHKNHTCNGWNDDEGKYFKFVSMILDRDDDTLTILVEEVMNMLKAHLDENSDCPELFNHIMTGYWNHPVMNIYVNAISEINSITDSCERTAIGDETDEDFWERLDGLLEQRSEDLDIVIKEFMSNDEFKEFVKDRIVEVYKTGYGG
jgi:hypothetical protein